MNCKTLIIAAAASASILGLSAIASAQVYETPHIQSDGGRSGRMITGREVYAPRVRGPGILAPFFWHGHYYHHRHWRDGRWFYGD
jgi:hypothetical protein